MPVFLKMKAIYFKTRQNIESRFYGKCDKRLTVNKLLSDKFHRFLYTMANENYWRVKSKIVNYGL